MDKDTITLTVVNSNVYVDIAGTNKSCVLAATALLVAIAKKSSIAPELIATWARDVLEDKQQRVRTMPITDERIQRYVTARNAMLEKFDPDALLQFLADHPEWYPRSMVTALEKTGSDGRMLVLCQVIAMSEGLSKETKEKARAWRRAWQEWEYRRDRGDQECQ